VASANGGSVAALVAVNTTLSACAGAMAAMAFSSWLDLRLTGVYSYDVVATMNGCLTGLVAITSGCATVQTWAAVLTGIGAGITYVLASKLMVRLRIDDAVDAVPVHMFGGAWGLLCTGLFTAPDLLTNAYGDGSHSGWFYEWSQGSGDFALMGCQLIAILFIAAWCFVIMGGYFYFLHFMGWFRCDPIEEEAGMDLSRHKGPAYDIQSVDPTVTDALNTSRRHLTLDSSNRSRRSAAAAPEEKAVEEVVVVVDKDDAA
jgi:Amt family ammonium transporter